MVVVIVFIILFLITQGFVLIEEETLILLAGLFWVDLAGVFFKDFLISELEHRGAAIKSVYLKFFSFKEDNLMVLYSLHQKRLFICNEVSIYSKSRNIVLSNIFVNGLSSFLGYHNIGVKFLLKESIIFLGFIVISDIFLVSLKPFLLKYGNK